MHRAAYKNYPEIAQILIEAGADISAKDKYGKTPLHDATFRNSPEIAQLLIDAGADIEAKSKYGSTPLHRTAWQGSIDAMRALLQAGADPNARTKIGKTALMGAASHAFLPDWEEGKEFNHETKTYEYPYYDERLVEGKKSLITSLAMLKLLIEYGADPYAVDNKRNNARDNLHRHLSAPNIKKYFDELGVKTRLELLREQRKKEAKAKEE